MTVQTLVTIIIPTFNREKVLSDAIESVLNQTYQSRQIIVIDDGSTDQTAKLIKKYPQIEYYYKENGGQASARNLGLKNAKGSIIASLDSDDFWYPDFLARCVEKLESDEFDFVFANWDQDSKGGTSWSFLAKDPFLNPYIKNSQDEWFNLKYEETRDLFLRACPSPSSSVVFRKSSSISGWDENIKIGDDWCMYLEMILNKECKVAFTLDILWRKRIDDMNIYDGRKWSEVLENLYVSDLNKKIIKFKHLITNEELNILQERHILSMVELAKHNALREFNIPHAFTLLRRAFKVNAAFTLKAIPEIFMKGLRGKIKDFRENKGKIMG